jgi:hypothetical protein
VKYEEFCSLLDERGGDIVRWPVHLREGAQTLLAGSAQARAALKAMQEVESLLVGAPARGAPLDIGVLAARATRQPQARRPLMIPALRKASFAALGVMALAAGILIGATPPSGTAIVGSVQMALNGGANDVW